MSKSEKVHINPLGFREYDARWIYKKDINQTGVEILGKGLGSQIIKHTKRKKSKNNSWSRLQIL